MSLPVRGQCTKTNARTRKCPNRTVAAKQKITFERDDLSGWRFVHAGRILSRENVGHRDTRCIEL